MRTERYVNLDTIIWIARDPSMGRFQRLCAEIASVQDAGGATATAPAGRHQLDPVFRRADYNVVLRRMNALWDAADAARKQPTFAARSRAAERALEHFPRLQAKVMKSLLSPRADQTLGSEWVADLIVTTFMPHLARAGVLQERLGVRRNATIVALALVAHRGERGRYPGKLDALAPAYLKEVPIDICSGGPLIYKVIGDGFVLYSVGENLRDDGGRTAADGEGFDDIVIRVPAPHPAGP
jgi:hypothetical protein